MKKYRQNFKSTSLCVAVAITLLSVSATEPLPPPSAEVAVSADFMKKLSRLPIQRTEDIDTTLNRTRIITRVNVNGIANIQPWQTGKDGLGMCITASNAIHSDIDATISAPGQIFVRSDAEANTNTSSHKCFFLNTSGLKAHPAATSAATKLTVKNIDVWAGGIFRRIKERLGRAAAERALAKQIPQNEREISDKAVKTINDLFDNLTAPMVKKANEAWTDWVRDATLNTKLIPHPPKFLTTKSAAYIVVPGADGPHQTELAPQGDEAILMKVRPKYIRDLAKTYLADFTFSDMELLHLVLNPTGDYTSAEELIGSNEDIVVKFSGETPIDVSMQDQTVTLSANFDSVTTLGQTYNNVTMRVHAQIKNNSDEVSLILSDNLEVIDTHTGIRNESLSSIFTSRWALVVTGKKEFKLETLRRSYAPWLPLRIAQIDAKDNSLTVIAVNGSESEFQAINKKIAEMIGIK